jgi:uncharacterized protein YjiS (DUF1127 family)
MELVISESRMWATKFKTWFFKAMKSLIEARQAEANRRIAMMHLHRMSDKELHDIGIGRGDIRRIVYEGK